MDNQGSNVRPDRYPTTVDRVPSINDEKSLERDEGFYYVKADVEATSNPPTDDASDAVLHTEREIATRVISVDDDPSLNPWTFRAFFLGLGLSAFGGSLGAFISLVVFSSTYYYTKQPRSIISNR
jgi:hypothetical protein